MRPNLKSIIVLLLLYNVMIITFISIVSGQQLQQYPFDGERDKRALDLGLVLRNILFKSAYASNSKAAVSRNLLNAKLTKTTTTTTTPRPTRPRPAPATLPPLFGNKTFFFPFDFSASLGAFQPINKFNNVQGNPPAAAGGRGRLRGGYVNFDYDYLDQQRLVAPPRRRRPTTTTTAAPTTTTTEPPAPAPRPPPPPAALPPRRRPFGVYGGRPKFLNYDYYDDYDYPENEPTTPAPPPPPPATRRPRPRPRRPPQQNQASGTGPGPRPGAGAGPGPGLMAPGRTGARQNRPQRIRDPLIYPYAQTNDISINNGNAAQTADSAPATADNANTQATNDNGNANASDNDDVNVDVNVDDDVDNITAPQDTNEQNNQDMSSDDDDVGANAAFDPSNTEDYNDSSDNTNANVNSNGNGNGSNNDNAQLNTTNGNDRPTNQSPPPNSFNNNPIDPRLNAPTNDQFADFPFFNGPAQGPLSSQPFGNSASGFQNFQFPAFNGFNAQYPQPSSPLGYSVRYY